MANQYLALTIGPIIDTLLSARKTREVWGGSYMFSYIIRKIVEELKEEHNVLLPTPDEIKTINTLGAGLYPDRIIVEANDRLTSNQLNEISQKVINDFAKQAFSWLSKQNQGKISSFENPFSENDMTSYCKDYIRVIIHPFIVVEESAKSITEIPIKKSTNIIEISTTYLDSYEQQYKIIPEENRTDQNGLSPLRVFLNQVNGSFLYKDGFSGIDNNTSLSAISKLVSEKPREGFDSLIEIATRELKVIDRNKYRTILENGILKMLKNPSEEDLYENKLIEDVKYAFTKQFKHRHKYVAIVHADGDKIGKIVKQVGELSKNIKGQNAINEFSKELLKYARKATEIVVEYGGSPVYMGGDDMLFFAPVSFRHEAKGELLTIFDLIHKLDIEFINTVKEYAKNTVGVEITDLPTLTFGISLSYYKFPLYEAKTTSYNLMKEYKENDWRNNIGFEFRKHSGQIINIRLDKNRIGLFDESLRLIKRQVNKTEFLNSFTYKLDYQKEFLKKISNDDERLVHFFKNNFNEEYDQNENFFKELIILIKTLAQTSTSKPEINGTDIDYIYGILRFIHFINADDK
jgi:CRISPR-associated protein Cmr2